MTESVNVGKKVHSSLVELGTPVTESGIIIPIVNESIIKFIQAESSNLKFVRECFDFAYDRITVNESGTKVLLTTNEGDTLVVNIENYIHNELMNYGKDTFKSQNIFNIYEDTNNNNMKNDPAAQPPKEPTDHSPDVKAPINTSDK